IHFISELAEQLIAIACEKKPGVMQIRLVIFCRNKIDTRRRAAFDLILQARARAIIENAVFTLANAKSFLKEIQTFFYSADIWKWAKVIAPLFLRAAMKRNARIIFAAGNKNIGVGFIVPQQNIVRRAIGFNQVLLKD